MRDAVDARCGRATRKVRRYNIDTERQEKCCGIIREVDL